MIRSDVVGSLLRPSELKAARERAEGGELSPAELKRIEDRAVDEAVRLQEEAGLDVVTDGELRRYAFFGHLIDALDGFDKLGGWAIPFHNEQGDRLQAPGGGGEAPLAAQHVHRGVSVAELRARVDEAARYLPRERLALSPQCGFASTMEGNRISPEEQRAKLHRVAEPARLIWNGDDR